MNILLTSVGRRSYMVNYFKEALNSSGMVHAANSEETYAIKIADYSIITPTIYDEQYIEFLITYCKQHDISALISLFDIDLPVLAKHKDIFNNNGITLVVSDFKITEICNDKWQTYLFLLENNFATPKSFKSLEKCKNALKNNEISFPLIIKPRWGMGSIGIYEVENEAELEILYLKVKRAIESSYLKYESRADIENAIILQEKLVGQEYGIDVFNDLRQNYICTIPKKKIAMRNGETDIAEIIENSQLEKLGFKLSSVLKHIANLDVDIFLVNGTFYILELNARFGGQYPFSHLAGVNFPKIIIDQLAGKPINPEHSVVVYNTIGIKNLELKKL